MAIKKRFKKRDAKPVGVDADVRNRIKNRRERRKKQGKSTDIAAPRKRYPKGVERSYRKFLRQYVAQLEAAVKKVVLPRIPQIINELSSQRPDSKDIRIDVESFKSALDAQVLEGFSDNELATMVKRTGNRVNTHSKEAMGNAFKRVIGVDPLFQETFIAQEVELFVIQNVRLIESIKTKYYDDVEGIVMRGAQKGLPEKEIGKMIADRTGVTKRRGDLIARDQVASLNGNIDQQRQKNLGVSEYIWRTVGDERVRDEHAGREGKKFKWSNPPFDGHPGEPINCRCVAEPIISGIVE